MSIVIRKVKQDVPIIIEISGDKDKNLMLRILQQARLPRNQSGLEFNTFVSQLESAFRYELNAKD